ncbi:ABC transporter permease [bacterium]|nr:ABC transporter permease [bacterium]
MIQNYLKIAFRNLIKHKSYSLINISGLAVGITCCMLIMLFVIDELSYDRFHEGASRIYRANLKARLNSKDMQMAMTPAPMAEELVKIFPEIESSTRLKRSGNFTVRYGEKVFNEKKFYFGDPSVFDVFSFTMIFGDPKTALTEPNSVVLTEETAQKYFGDENPVGKILRMDGRNDYKVTGVMKNIPHNSHVHFDLLASMSTLEESRDPWWISNNFYTYIKLRENQSYKALEEKFIPLVREKAGPQIQIATGASFDEFLAMGGDYGFFLISLTDIHLFSDIAEEPEPQGNIAYVYIFSAIAFFILLIACINFMNLTTARSAGRAKEIGIRKVLGSYRTQLIRLFMAESIMVSFIALAIAMVLTEILIPLFNELSGKQLSLNYFEHSWVLPGLLTIGITVGLIAGSYPAFFLSAFQPVKVLKGELSKGVRSGWLRSTLVVMQFGISIALMIGTGIVFDQIEYLRSKKLGFDKERVAVIHNAWLLRDQKHVFKQEILKQPFAANATMLNSNLGGDMGNSGYQVDNGTNETFLLWRMNTDFNFVPTMNIELAEGRNFSKEFLTDSGAVLINETAARIMGLQKPLDHHIIELDPDKKENAHYPIIGVVKDFHFESLHEPIRPMIIMPTWYGSYLNIRLQEGDPKPMLQAIESTWNQFLPGEPFVYSFLDEDFDALYRAEYRVSKIVTIFSLLAVFIACLGLLGLAAFTTEQRTKEIGVRKVLGASVAHIVTLLSRDFLKLVSIAFVVAAPVAYWGMYIWLQDFAYRTSIGAAVFIISGVLAVAVAFLTVSYQAIKAATSNPVDVLKYE